MTTNILHDNNYRDQRLEKCCYNCRHSSYDSRDAFRYCNVNGRGVSNTGICDKHEPREDHNAC